MANLLVTIWKDFNSSVGFSYNLSPSYDYVIATPTQVTVNT